MSVAQHCHPWTVKHSAPTKALQLCVGHTLIHVPTCHNPQRRLDGRAFNFGGGGGGVDTALWQDPPGKKGAIDGPPKILPRLTPGPRT